MLSLKRHDTTLKYRRNSNTLYSTTSLPSFSSELAETTNVGQSKVDAIVFLFETGHYQQQRRHSLDSYHYNLKRTLIHEREFEFLPTVNEWRKREYGPPPFKYQLPISLSVSVSTPV
ncbi:hypothetical protein BY458DRAFT_529379 [Sporodiniella umbellata]|nr:hypothetical protein BY458DRAFT_529379 [Sporodiniella umbellata]